MNEWKLKMHICYYLTEPEIEFFTSVENTFALILRARMTRIKVLVLGSDGKEVILHYIRSDEVIMKSENGPTFQKPTDHNSARLNNNS